MRIGSGQFPDNFHDESFFNRGKLRFDAGRHIESRRAPFLERKVRVGQHR